MSNYPDDLSQASFDRYWNDKLDDPDDEDEDMDEEETPEDKEAQLIDQAYEQWREDSY